MATGRRKKTLDDLKPEERAKVEAAAARWQTPEAREREIRDREALAEEYRRTRTIAGEPAGPDDPAH